MHLILLQNVPKLGQKDDLVKVKDGHGLNCLIPQKKAMVATPSLIQAAEKRRALRVMKAEDTLKNAQEVAKKLKDTTLTFKRKAEGDKLFGSVTEKDILEGLKSEFKIELTKEMIALKDHLKTVGAHAVSIRLSPQVGTSVKIVVEAE